MSFAAEHRTWLPDQKGRTRCGLRLAIVRWHLIELEARFDKPITPRKSEIATARLRPDRVP